MRSAGADRAARAGHAGHALGHVPAFGTQRFQIRFEQGRLTELVDRLTQALEESGRPMTRVLLALAHCELDHDEDARRVFEPLAATLVDLASCLLSSGHLSKAEEICRSTLGREHDPKVDGALRLCLVQIHVGQGRVAKSLQAIDEAVQSPALTERERGRLWAWASTCRVIIWDLDGAAASAERALAVCAEIEDDLGGTVALASLAAIQNLRGNFSEALRMAEEALAQARRSRSPDARRLQLTLMHTLLLIDARTGGTGAPGRPMEPRPLPLRFRPGKVLVRGVGRSDCAIRLRDGLRRGGGRPAG